VLGVFNNKSDASKYLNYARERGFKDSYIVSQYEINTTSKSLVNPDTGIRQISGKILYTIQLKAARKPIDMNLFKGIDGVREIASPDGYYRYVTGEYISYKKAMAAVAAFHESGYNDAFIRDLNLLLHK
jgi:hypothetical protein